MKPRRSASIAAAAGVLLGALAHAQAPAQKPEAWTHRTPDGQPDLQGTWVNFDSTPFESDTTGPLGTIPNVNPPAHWADHDSPVSAKRRSMVVDPPDGRVPVMKWAEDKRDFDLAHLEDHYRHETAWVRCITRGVPGGMFPAGYNNAYEIVQIPGYVIIVYEMIHDTRIIPLDGRPHLPSAMRQYLGDSRGRWEGDTLVVETTNFHPNGNPMGGYFTLSDQNLRLIERFRRTAADTLEYTFTVDNPTMWTKPWTAVIYWKASKGEVLEYACHEGNYSLRGMLSAARADEAAGR